MSARVPAVLGWETISKFQNRRTRMDTYEEKASPREGIDPGLKETSDELTQKIVTVLEEDIVFGRLSPRERLIEEDLTGRFGAKRHIVRQALVELERLGLVERVRNRGAIVKLYEAEEVEDINEVRELLETYAASLIPLPLDEAALLELEAIQSRHSEAIETDNTREVFRANIQFHQVLFAHCGNESLIEAINIFSQKSHAYRSIFVNDSNYLRWAAGAHIAMIEALKTGERERLVSLCKAHLAPAKNRYIETWRSRFE